MKITIQLLILIAIYCCSTRSQRLSAKDESSLRSFIQSLMQCKDNIGATVSLVRNGEIIFAEGFGYRDLNRNLPMQNNTKINIASLTKSFTATLAAQAIGKGNVDWNTPIKDILGQRFGLDGPFRTQQASLRDVFSHKLGLPKYWGVTTAALNITREELCMRRLRHFPSLYDFRSKYTYSNYGYILGAYVTEVLTGKTWEEGVNQLFADLGMRDTIHAAEIKPSDWGTNIAYSYLKKGGVNLQVPEQEKLPFLIRASPAGGILSTAEDMGKWMLFHLSKGKNKSGQQIVPAATLSELHKPITATERKNLDRPIYPVGLTEYAYGMGFRLGTYRGFGQLTHTGVYSSFRCRMTLIPTSSVGIWSCVNSPGYGESLKQLHMYGLDKLLAKSHKINETTACTFPAPWEPVNPPSTNPRQPIVEECPNCSPKRYMREYAGDYGHPGFGTFKIYVHSSSGQLRYKFGLLLHGELTRTQDPMEMIMSIGFPLNYTTDSTSFSTYFAESSYKGGVIETVKVPYLEDKLPPIFKRGYVPMKPNAAGYNRVWYGYIAIQLCALAFVIWY